MRCPHCDSKTTKVSDSRPQSESIRRRRKCPKCSYRFTTFERTNAPVILVRKARDRRVEAYDQEKLDRVLRSVCHKTRITQEDLKDIANSVAESARPEGETRAYTVESRAIAEHVMNQLEKRDRTAYTRFASHYETFYTAIDAYERCQMQATLHYEKELTKKDYRALCLLATSSHALAVRHDATGKPLVHAIFFPPWEGHVYAIVDHESSLVIDILKVD